MATQDHVRIVEYLIKYEFEIKSWAFIALTAAGAEEFNHHGNRMCARYGRLLIELYVLNNTHKAGVPPSTVNDFTTDALRKTRHGCIAKEKGIDKCIMYSPRQGSSPPTDTTLSNAICAIIGAAYLDSQNTNVPFRAIEVLGLGESQLLAAKDLVNPQNTSTLQAHPTTISQSSPNSEDDISWAIESVTTDGDLNAEDHTLTALVLPSVEELYTADFMSDLAIDGAESQSTPSSESWRNILNYHPDNNADMDVVSPQDSPSFSPAMSPLVFVDMPRDIHTPTTPSAEAFNENLEISLQNDTARVETISAHDLSTVGTGVEVCEPTIDVGQQSTAIKRKAPITGLRSKRTKPQPEQVIRFESESVQVRGYIQLEKEKCERLGIPYIDENSFPSGVAKWISTLDKEYERAAVSMISTAIGSSESIALFQHVVVQSRAKDLETKPAENLSLAVRVREIRLLSDRIAFIEFIRRCHVWKLYTDISSQIRSPKSGFVIATPASMNVARTRRPGNPNNVIESEITKAMLCGVAPDLEIGSPEYKKQYRFFSTLRKLGQRLALLTKTFGFGVLGLIPSQDTFENANLGFKISDETILIPLDKTFDDFVELLNTTQGDIIRKLSSAIEGVVTSIFDGTLPSSPEFAIEKVEQGQILSQPRGSDRLFQLLSSNL